jgi:hypothetical protein
MGGKKKSEVPARVARDRAFSVHVTGVGGHAAETAMPNEPRPER